MIVRRAADADRAAIAAIHAQSWRDSYGGILPDAFLGEEIGGVMAARWAEQPVGEADAVLVAEEGGSLLGFVAAWDGESAYIDNLHVRAEARSRGAGRRLLAETARHFLARGRRGAHLHVVATNHRARALYLALGGVAAGLVEKNLYGTPVMNERIVWDDLTLLLERAGIGYSEAVPNPIAIRDIDHVVFRVLDLEEVFVFWRDVLGATFEKRQEEIGLYQLRVGNSLVDLVPVDGKLGRMGGAAPGKEGRNVDHVAFRVPAWDETAILAHLAGHGIEAQVDRRYGADGDGPSIYLHDPEGNMIELKGPPG
jgi:glyoxylase I family protein